MMIKKTVKHLSRKVLGAALAAVRAPLRVKVHRKKRALSRKLAGAALAVAAVPYHFQVTRESGNFELRGLLWTLKKEFDGQQHCYTVDLLPFLTRDTKPEEPSSEQPGPSPRT